MIKKLFKPKMINKWLFTVAGLEGDPNTLLEWSDRVWKVLEHGYNDPSRHYHNFDHIYDCLKKYEKIRSLLFDPISVELAIWFHDIVYNPLSKFSEDDSAKIAFDFVKELDEELALKVHDLVLFTKWDSEYFYADTLEEIHETFPDATEDFFYLRDIDWSGFGSPVKRFKATTSDLRAEVPYITQDEFNERRTAFMKVLVCLPRPLYCTPWLRDRYTEQAEINIQNELRDLHLQKNK